MSLKHFPHTCCLLALMAAAFIFDNTPALAQPGIPGCKLIAVDSGWARNSVNVVIFRKNSLVTHGQWQYIACYNAQGHVVLGKRKLKSTKWQLHTTAFTGKTTDAHNSISIMVDDSGYLHLAWDHHNNTLHYARSIKPGSLITTAKIAMTGKQEESVTYPEFQKMSGGKLLFLYRNGSSGNGNLVVNSYDIKTKKWTQLQNNLIDGEGRRNAYWQSFTDSHGTVHLSWVWRESPDVSSNHDLCYAKSSDGGSTWERSTGEKYQLPITAASAEYAAHIPQNSELINQTSMYADDNGNPYIATYWRSENDSIPQYRIVYLQNNEWKNVNTGFRKSAFSLSGVGSKRIPISRPQLITWKHEQTTSALLIFRDEERGSKVSLAYVTDINAGNWQVKDVTQNNVGSWEPSFDTELLRQKKQLHLFVQNADQADAEKVTDTPAQMVYVLEVDIKSFLKK